ncbi:SDR family NAD(P)-dependent oxidoreductase [Nocardia crassostreae]|uniref:SDR family NAD(P)-dependent oxidoreductase n=1 Tax=Nocardia crassostreae TaxID=53428 RepID=UPI000835BF9D|nr:SDR family NAD(P)-dependent oxidoreductase [Nocardia crassostreae]
MPHLAVFGAGPALGLSAARRFGKAGYSVTLIGRTAATLDTLRDSLTSDGVVTDGLTADLAEPDQAAAALRDLEARHGLPDVVVYSPGDVSRLPVNVLSLDVDTLRSWLPLHLLTPVRLLHELVPAMADRGHGAVIFGHGSSIRQPMPDLASVSVPQAGLVNYLHAIDAQVRSRGVRVGSLQIGRLIHRSAVAALLDSGHFDGVDAGQIVRVDPDELAEQVFEMATTDTAVERAA